jgi:hypothetical protein
MDFVRSSKSDKITLLLTTTQQSHRICLLSVYQLKISGWNAAWWFMSCRATERYVKSSNTFDATVYSKM